MQVSQDPDTPAESHSNMVGPKAIRSVALRLVVFLLPLIIILAAILIIDPLRVFRDHDNFYGAENFLELNRENICLRTFENNFPEHQYNAFIFGNSRSLAFSTSDWATYLPEDAVPFHFDGLGDTLWGVRNKLRYLKKRGAEIRYVLWALDEELLAGTSNQSNHLRIAPPALSGESAARFYKVSLQAILEPRMALAWIDYSLFQTRRDYMQTLIRPDPEAISMDPVTADIDYRVEYEIQKDPDAFYEPRMHIFYQRPATPQSEPSEITETHLNLLEEIATILRESGTDFRIVINPLYNQVPIHDDWLRTLTNVLGQDRIHNFSGVNDLTQDYRNYYETSHFRPHVASQILKSIYSE